MPKQFRNRPERDAFEITDRPPVDDYLVITMEHVVDEAAPAREPQPDPSADTDLTAAPTPEGAIDIYLHLRDDDAEPVEPTTEAAVDIFLHLSNDVHDANEPDGMIWGHDQPHEIVEGDAGGEIFADGFETGM